MRERESNNKYLTYWTLLLLLTQLPCLHKVTDILLWLRRRRRRRRMNEILRRCCIEINASHASLLATIQQLHINNNNNNFNRFPTDRLRADSQSQKSKAQTMSFLTFLKMEWTIVIRWLSVYVIRLSVYRFVVIAVGNGNGIYAV